MLHTQRAEKSQSSLHEQFDMFSNNLIILGASSTVSNTLNMFNALENEDYVWFLKNAIDSSIPKQQ